MADHERQSGIWRRSAVELVVIALGVFLALAADAAWDARQDSARELDYLERLYGEVLVSHSAVESAISLQAEARRSGDAAIEGINSVVPPPFDSLAAWTWRVGASAVFEPSLGALTALVQTGDMRLIGNDEVRDAALRHHQLIVNFRSQGERMDDHRLGAYRDLGQVIALDALPAPYGAAEPAISVDWQSAASDVRLHSSVFNALIAAKVRMDLLVGIEDSLGDLRRVLSEELTSRGITATAF